MQFYHRRIVSWLLVFTMIVSPTVVMAQQPGAGPAETINLSYVIPDAAVAAVVRPRRVLTSPAMEMLPVEVFSAVGRLEVGIDPVDVEQAIVLLTPPAGGPPEYGAVIRLVRPVRLQDLKPIALSGAQAVEIEGRPYYPSPDPSLPGAYMPDDLTLLLASEPLLRNMLAAKQHSTEGAMRQLLAGTEPTSDLRIVAAVKANREAVTSELDNVPVPPQWAGFLKMAELVDWAELDVALSGEERIHLRLVSADEQDATELRGLILQLLNIGHSLMLAQMNAEITGDDPVQQASMQYTQRMANKIFELLRPERNGSRVQIALEGNSGSQAATIGILVALLLPAVQQARDAARRSQSINNLRQIVLAMHTYHEAHRTFPARASFDADGRPLLSWRVHLLPYLDQETLYRQFRLDEPWDSEHNARLIERMPEIYINPAATTAPGRTVYQVPVGEGTAFQGREGMSFARFRDGTSNTILALETNQEAAVIWTQPEDWRVNPQNPLAGLGEAHRVGFNAAFADGHADFFSAMIDPNVFLALLTIAGGEPVDLP